MRDAALWSRLCGHTMVLSDGRTLAAALAERAGISNGRAEVVVREYTRFLYLVAATGLPLAPSRSVDAAWHLHLDDPPSYAVSLCDGVIGRKIVHATGGPAPIYDPAYATTFKAYREEFGLRPPWRVWPTAREDRRATAAIVILLLSVTAAVIARHTGHDAQMWVSGTVAVVAGMVYAVIAPYAPANRRKGGCTGCVAGAEDAADDLAKD